MLFSKVPIQLKKGEVANTKSRKKSVSVHYAENTHTKPPSNYKAKNSDQQDGRDGSFLRVC